MDFDNKIEDYLVVSCFQLPNNTSLVCVQLLYATSNNVHNLEFITILKKIVCFFPFGSIVKSRKPSNAWWW